jgi:hypothetical protein
MTTSFNISLSSGNPEPIVSSSFYPQPNPDDSDYKRNHRPQEVILVNTTGGATVYLGDAGAFYNETGIPVYAGSGIVLSLGSGDELFAWADDSISVPVMILDGKGR